MHPNRLIHFLVFLALAAGSAAAQDAEFARDRTELGRAISWGRPLLPAASSVVADDTVDERATTLPERVPLLLRDESHHVEIIGGLASVELVQQLVNDSPHSLEVTLVYDLPVGAAVHAMRVVIGDRVLEGEIREKEEARRELRAARVEGRRAAVVEQAAVGSFRTRITNVQPGDVIDVELSHDVVVPYEDGRFRLRLPVSRAGQGGLDSEALVEVVLAGGLPIAELRSASHELKTVASKAETVLHASAPKSEFRHDFLLEYTLGQVDGVGAATWVSPERDGWRELMALVVPPVSPEEDRWRRPTEVLFIIDSSGSMSGGSLDAAKLALDSCLADLRPEDRFNVVRYSSTHELLAATPLAATPDLVAKAREKVAALRSGGGTRLAPALKDTLRLPGSPDHHRIVVLLTDGHVGEPEAVLRLLDAELGEARLFVLGIGTAPNANLVREMASRGRGMAEFIEEGKHVEAALVDLLQRFDSPVAWDLRLDWGGLELDGVYPEYIPDVYAGQPVTVFARFRDEGRFNFEVIAETRQGLLEIPLAVNPDSATSHPAVGTLWARAHLNELEKGMREAVDEEGRAWWREELLGHALAHGLVTSVTSFLVVEAVPAADHGPEQHVDAAQRPAYPTTATQHPRVLLVGMIILLLGFALRVWDWFVGQLRMPRRMAGRNQVAP